jgi:hypothetical protein
VKPIPGTEIELIVPWTRKSRRGKFDIYDIDIDVFSMQDDSPSTQLQKLGAITQQYLIPLLPMIESAGGTINIKAFFEMLAKYSDFPEIAEIIRFAEGFSTDEVGNKEVPKSKPSNTTRTYERVNRPGATDRGKSQILQQALFGGKPQGSEIASLGRSTG